MKKAEGVHRLIHSGATRNPDHETSIQAAETVGKRRLTIRQRVEDFARRLPHGFIDEEVGLLDPAAPESSFRKRRTELADENIIVASEETRKNSKGQDCTVWRHRDHVINPPPLKPRDAKPSRFAQLQEENARLRAMVTMNQLRRLIAAEAVRKSYEEQCRATGSFTTDAIVNAVCEALGFEIVR